MAKISLIREGGFIKPASCADMPIFMHCCGGMIAVRETYFEPEVFKLHGLTPVFLKNQGDVR